LRLREPPRIKVLEAAGAIADGRVHLVKGLTPDRLDATVISSEGDRRYRVVVVKEGGGYRVYSDDNGTRLRGYVGYPIISVLMLAGALPRDEQVEVALKGIFPKGSALDLVLLYTAARSPALCRCRAMGPPIMPRPMNPTFMGCGRRPQ